MALKKEILVAANGAPAEIHRIDSITINKLSKTATVSLSSFYNEAALTQGLNPLAQVTVQLDGNPANGQDVTDFAEQSLVAAPPDGVTVDLVIHPYNTDRYVFAGAETIDV
ncbi:hypothetical protein [Paraburkholderia oxyphila]|uniref:hypothetical protein n=1 Tax=Paraburkholderia oxyphila TaxID=614212 RepID=UPI00047FF256|nr:hypothetical protein [Paraburkholderia oxyphila]